MRPHEVFFAIGLSARSADAALVVPSVAQDLSPALYHH
jgi:hypothetical protein